MSLGDVARAYALPFYRTAEAEREQARHRRRHPPSRERQIVRASQWLYAKQKNNAVIVADREEPLTEARPLVHAPQRQAQAPRVAPTSRQTN